MSEKSVQFLAFAEVVFCNSLILKLGKHFIKTSTPDLQSKMTSTYLRKVGKTRAMSLSPLDLLVVKYKIKMSHLCTYE